MITHISQHYISQPDLDALLLSEPVRTAVTAARAVLVQIFSANTDREHLRTVAGHIAHHLPEAIIVGATTVGEITAGRLLTGSTVVGITCFTTSSVYALPAPCRADDALTTGRTLGTRINACPGRIAGVLLLGTPLSIDASALLQGLAMTAGDYPIFGGGAGDYAAMSHSLVLAGDTAYDQGAIAVVLCGEDLHIESQTYLGWRPLSKTMRVTRVNQLHVETVDDMPAFEVYRRYLNIANDAHFFLNALEFPFLLERDGQTLARVPVAATDDGSLQFVADVAEGETFRIGYGDMELIVNDAQAIHQAMTTFSPQAIFLYSCGCRRFLMQNDADLETLPFESIAPTFGFYTYGEFFSSPRLRLLNSTLVAVGLREGAAAASPTSAIAPRNLPSGSDPYAHKHTRVVSRLIRFIDAVASELEASNRAITQLSRTDHLTQLANRIQLDHVLETQLQRARLDGIPFAIILLDLDHFKAVNDQHGHLVGDEVLMHTARLLAMQVCDADTVGRWGGEEFLIVVANTTLDTASQLAERLRQAIEDHPFPQVGRQTGSLGVTGFVAEDDVVKMINRADSALYAAKGAGRNRVRVANGSSTTEDAARQRRIEQSPAPGKTIDR